MANMKLVFRGAPDTPHAGALPIILAAVHKVRRSPYATMPKQTDYIFEQIAACPRNGARLLPTATLICWCLQKMARA